MSKIAIIGGGLSGVSCAYELTRHCHENGGHTDFVLYESSSRLGGIVETIAKQASSSNAAPIHGSPKNPGPAISPSSSASKSRSFHPTTPIAAPTC